VLLLHGAFFLFLLKRAPIREFDQEEEAMTKHDLLASAKLAYVPEVAAPAAIPFAQRPSCTVKEACAATGLSRTTIYECMAAGQLAATTVGRRRLINVPSLLSLVGSNPEAAAK
jgi:excisionase family DNA binding protein